MARIDYSEEERIDTFEALYRAEYSGVVNYVRRIAPTRAAEDVAAEAFTALWQTLETGQVQEPKGLLYRIAEGLAIDSYRRDRREMLVDAQEMQEPGKLENLGAVGALPSAPPCFGRSFDGAVRSLEDEQRAAFILTELRGLTTREAADVLTTSHMTVHRRAETARQLIRREIAA